MVVQTLHPFREPSCLDYEGLIVGQRLELAASSSEGYTITSVQMTNLKRGISQETAWAGEVGAELDLEVI